MERLPDVIISNSATFYAIFQSKFLQAPTDLFCKKNQSVLPSETWFHVISLFISWPPLKLHFFIGKFFQKAELSIE
jgi:hypothetical protein